MRYAATCPAGRAAALTQINAKARTRRHQRDMDAVLHAITALCGVSGPAPAGGLWLGLFLAGAAGSAVHCGPMCGGFVLGQAADRLAAVPVAQLCEWRRLRAGALLPYHAGRLTTYAALGAAAGFGGASLAAMPGFRWLAALLLLCAAGLFLLHALRRSVPALAALLPRVAGPGGWSRHLARLAHRAGGSAFWLGLALGFLPCGFLYAALAAAASTASPWRGAGAMVAFGLGTAPVLVAIGIAGQAAGQIWQRSVMRAAPVVMLLNAVLLATLAAQRLMSGA
jgi:hypothetical protein